MKGKESIESGSLLFVFVFQWKDLNRSILTFSDFAWKLCSLMSCADPIFQCIGTIRVN